MDNFQIAKSVMSLSRTLENHTVQVLPQDLSNAIAQKNVLVF